MNKNCYRIVWNRKLGLLQVASEIARARGTASPKIASPVPSLKMTLVGKFSLMAAAVMTAWGLLMPIASAEVIIGDDGKRGAIGMPGRNGENANPGWGPVDGGRGGDGGTGETGKAGFVVLRGTTSGVEFVNTDSIFGGNGGVGGTGGDGGTGGVWGGLPHLVDTYSLGGNGGNGGQGGLGGSGVSIEAGDVIYKNLGNITGGSRGAGGVGGKGGEGDGADGFAGRDGPQGARSGYGISVDNANTQIINSGTISPGAGGTVAVMYNVGSSTSRLELQKGSNILGTVDARASTGSNTFALGASNAADQGQFNVSQIGTQYLGFNAFQKTGAGTWELTDTTWTETPWTIYDGTLRISSDGALGSAAGTLTFGAADVMAGTTRSQGTGRLEVMETTDMDRDIVLEGNGVVDIAAGKSLSSYGNISGAGTLTVSGSGDALSLSGVASRSSGGLTLLKGGIDFGMAVRYSLTGAYTQATEDTHLNITLDTKSEPVISAGTASLGGALNVKNYSPSEVSGIASQLGTADRIIIATSDGISGDFSSGSIDQDLPGYDYLRKGGVIKGNNYVMGLSLAWDSAAASHGNFTLNNGNFMVDQVLAKRADGADELTKNGAGTLTLVAHNTYAGVTTVNGGTLALSDMGNISQSSAVVIRDGATVDVSGVKGGQTRINNLSGTAAGTVALGSTELTINTSEKSAFAGAITGRGGLIKTGGEVLSLSAANAYTGATKIAAGTLSADARDIMSASSGLEVAEGATFKMNGYDQAIAKIQSEGTGGSIDLGNATLTLTGGASTATYAGNITGTGNVVKEGNYTQYLSGDGTLAYSGSTTVNAGVLALRNISPTIDKSIVLNGGWLDLSGADNGEVKDWSGLVITTTAGQDQGGVIGYGDKIHLSDGRIDSSIGAGGDEPDARDGVYVLKDSAGETILGGADNTYVGNTQIAAGILTVSRDGLLGNTDISREVILSGGTLRVDGSYDSKRALQLAAAGTIDVTAGNASEWQGGVAGATGKTSEHGLSKIGAGTLVLSGANDYRGDTVVAQGTLALKDRADLHGGNLVFAADGADASFDVSGLYDGVATIGTLTDNGSGSIIALGGSMLEILGGGVFNGVIKDAALSGETGGGILKSGNNVLTFSGAHNYSGATNIAGGVLALTGDGSIAASSALNLASAGAVFDISKTASGASVNDLNGMRDSAIELGSQTLAVNQSTDGIFAGDMSGAGGVEKNGTASLTLSGNTGYTGDTVLKAGKLVLDGSAGGAQLVSNIIGQSGSALSLMHGASLTGSIDPTGLSIDAASVWNMTASSVVDVMDLAGRVDFAAPALSLASGRTLTASNWNGDGGTVKLYSVLDGSNSVTDQILIDGGSATGNTNLHVVNAGGLGAQTSGDGIQVVVASNGAVTAENAFKLDRKLFAGAYEYQLQRGGTESAQDWFLVSQSRSETALYGSLGNQGLGYGEVVAGTLQQRMGALEQLLKKNDTYAWGRIYGQADDQRGTTRTMGQQTDTRGIQVGSDLYVISQGEGRDSAGIYFAGGQSHARIEQYDGKDNLNAFAGSNISKGYSIGAYFTRLDGGGAYLDTLLQLTRYNIGSQSANNITVSTHGFGALGSLEVGKAFDLGEGRKIEPQAQLSLQQIGLRNFMIDEGTGVNFDSSRSLASRVGLRLSKTKQPDQFGRDASIWLASDLLNNSGRNSKTIFTTQAGAPDVEYVEQLAGTRVRLSAGADGQISKNVKLNVRASAETSVDASHRKSYGLQLGLKLAF